MPSVKPAAKTFEAILERTTDRLNWVIVRIPFDVAKVWGKRGQLRVKGSINSFDFRSALFPTGQGSHFLLVNKKMQLGAKTAPGAKARFELQPDMASREITAPSSELLRELGQSKRLLKFYESLNPSRRNEIARWVAEPKSVEARQRRSQQIVERLMETMEAERELPPIMQLAFRQNPRAREKWEQMSQSHRRAHLLAIFYYRIPEARVRRVDKCIQELLARAGKAD
ncbi:MAG TPA: YdeI/OmpD-associated family protein [Candidatus Angelobacter sp.]|jgi:uncharacterized protein YdeI (YjbR/CyaY-like superfamily)